MKITATNTIFIKTTIVFDSHRLLLIDTALYDGINATRKAPNHSRNRTRRPETGHTGLRPGATVAFTQTEKEEERMSTALRPFHLHESTFPLSRPRETETSRYDHVFCGYNLDDAVAISTLHRPQQSNSSFKYTYINQNPTILPR